MLHIIYIFLNEKMLYFIKSIQVHVVGIIIRSK